MKDAIMDQADVTTAHQPASRPSSVKDRLRNALAARNLDQLEELVLELVSSNADLPDVDSLINDIGDRLERIGEAKRAVPILMIAATELRPQGMARQALGWLKRAARLAPCSEGLSQELAETYRAAYPNHSGLDSLLESAGLLNTEPGIKPRLREAIDDMENALFLNEGDFVLHQGGWGVGKVRTVHAERSVLVVDFQTKPGHEIAMTMAKKALRKLEPDHVAVLRWTEPERLSSMAKDDPVGLLKLAVHSLGGTALLKEVRASLSGAAMPEGEWSRWWAKARKAAAGDPLLEITGAPKTTLHVLEKPRDQEAEVQDKFKRSFTISERVSLARSYMRDSQDGRRGGRQTAKQESNQTLPPALTSMITAISEELGAPPEDIKEDSVRPGRRDQLACRLEAVLVVREAARRFADCPEIVDASAAHPATDEIPAPEILAGRLRLIADSPTRVEALYTLDEAFGEEAADSTVALLKAPGLWDIFEEGAALLAERGHADHFKELAVDLLLTPRNHPDALAAFARAHLSGRLEELCHDIGNPIELALKTLNVLDYLGRELQMVVSDTRKLELKASLNHLRTTLLERGALALKRLADDGTTEDVDQAFRLIRRTSGLTDNQKYQLEKPLIKAHPDVVKRNEPAAAAAAREAPKVIYSTNSGLARREAELRHLVEVDIPENSRDIGRAAAMGDLSENAEWTAAIERQGFLTKRAEELEAELKRVQVLDPSNTDVSRATFGTRVTLRNVEDQTEERYAILGPWDKDTECEVISHLATLAEAIQGHAPGDEVEVDLPECRKRYEIKAIELAIPAEFVAPKRAPSNTADD